MWICLPNLSYIFWQLHTNTSHTVYTYHIIGMGGILAIFVTIESELFDNLCVKFINRYGIIFFSLTKDTGWELRMVGTVRKILGFQAQSPPGAIGYPCLSFLFRDKIAGIELYTEQC